MNEQTGPGGGVAYCTTSRIIQYILTGGHFASFLGIVDILCHAALKRVYFGGYSARNITTVSQLCRDEGWGGDGDEESKDMHIGRR